MLSENDMKTLDAMDVYGGSFVVALARACRFADPDNLGKIKGAFPEYWAQYRKMAGVV